MTVNEILIFIKVIMSVLAIIGNIGICIYLWIDRRR